ncbi:Ig-like domain-containing protein [Bacteroides sp.]|uniref:Ig-like domain-containing protein n=1 Tax=Bacteroides sp. TaxID=29523 RepID=UPI00260DDA74|nr:Ig-like domain-containing protein [Bacteroides sp.]
MKKIFSLMLLCATVLLTSCKDDDDPIIATTVSLDKEVLSLVEGTTGTLTATITPDNVETKDLTWMSCDETVATVDGSGVVTALKVGEATITVVTRSGGKSASCVVKVTPAPIAVTGITLDNAQFSLSADEKAQLTATIAPEDATNTNVTWTTSDAGIATVSPTGEVTAVGVGVATITATTEDGGKTATCIVTVADRANFLFYGVKNKKLVYYDGQSLKPVEGASAYSIAVSALLNKDFYAMDFSGNAYKNGVICTDADKIPTDISRPSKMFAAGNSLYIVGTNIKGEGAYWKDGNRVFTAGGGMGIEGACVLGEDAFVALNNRNAKTLVVAKGRDLEMFELPYTGSITVNDLMVYDGKVYLVVYTSSDKMCRRYVYNGTTMVEDASVEANTVHYIGAKGGLFAILTATDKTINVYKTDWSKALPSLAIPSGLTLSPYGIMAIGEGNDTYVYGGCENATTKQDEIYVWKNSVDPIRMPADTIRALVHISE